MGLSQKRSLSFIRKFLISTGILIIMLIGAWLLINQGKELSQQEEYIKFVGPSTYEFEVETTGRYNLYVMLKGEFEGKSYEASEEIKGIKVKLYGPNQEEMTVANPDLEYIFNNDKERGKTLFTCDMKEKGNYIIEVTQNTASNKEPVLFAIGKANSSIVSIFAYLTSACVIALLGVIQWLWMLIKQAIALFTQIRQK